MIKNDPTLHVMNDVEVTLDHFVLGRLLNCVPGVTPQVAEVCGYSHTAL